MDTTDNTKLKDLPCLYFASAYGTRAEMARVYYYLSQWYGMSLEAACEDSRFFAQMGLFGRTPFTPQEILSYREDKNSPRGLKACALVQYMNCADEHGLVAKCCSICEYSHDYKNYNRENEAALLKRMDENSDLIKMVSARKFRYMYCACYKKDITTCPPFPVYRIFYEHLRKEKNLRDREAIAERINDYLKEKYNVDNEEYAKKSVSDELRFVKKSIIKVEDTLLVDAVVNSPSRYAPSVMVKVAVPEIDKNGYEQPSLFDGFLSYDELEERAKAIRAEESQKNKLAYEEYERVIEKPNDTAAVNTEPGAEQTETPVSEGTDSLYSPAAVTKNEEAVTESAPEEVRSETRPEDAQAVEYDDTQISASEPTESEPEEPISESGPCNDVPSDDALSMETETDIPSDEISETDSHDTGETVQEAPDESEPVIDDISSSDVREERDGEQTDTLLISGGGERVVDEQVAVTEECPSEESFTESSLGEYQDEKDRKDPPAVEYVPDDAACCSEDGSASAVSDAEVVENTEDIPEDNVPVSETLSDEIPENTSDKIADNESETEPVSVPVVDDEVQDTVKEIKSPCEACTFGCDIGLALPLLDDEKKEFLEVMRNEASELSKDFLSLRTWIGCGLVRKGDCDNGCIYCEPNVISPAFEPFVLESSDGMKDVFTDFLHDFSVSSDIAVDYVTYKQVEGLLFYLEGKYYFFNPIYGYAGFVKSLLSGTEKRARFYSSNPVPVYNVFDKMKIFNITIESVCALYSVARGSYALAPTAAIFEKYITAPVIFNDYYANAMPRYKDVVEDNLPKLTPTRRTRYKEGQKLEKALARNYSIDSITRQERNVFGGNFLQYKFALSKMKNGKDAFIRTGTMFAVTLSEHEMYWMKDHFKVKRFFEKVAGEVYAPVAKFLDQAHMIFLNDKTIVFYVTDDVNAFYDHLLHVARKNFRELLEDNPAINIQRTDYIESVI